MNTVFISYAREDRIVVQKLYSLLINDGYAAWVDYINILPGKDWEYEIDNAIKNSKIFLACLSNKSVNKRGYFQAELKKAIKVLDNIPEGDVYIIPVKLEECRVPRKLESLQWVDFYLPQGVQSLQDALASYLKGDEKSEFSRASLNYYQKHGLITSLETEKKLFADSGNTREIKLIGKQNKIENEDLAILKNTKLHLVICQTLIQQEFVAYFSIVTDQNDQKWIGFGNVENIDNAKYTTEFVYRVGYPKQQKKYVIIENLLQKISESGLSMNGSPVKINKVKFRCDTESDKSILLRYSAH